MSKLSDLKAGDYAYTHDSCPSILNKRKIVRVTPTGRIVTICGKQFNPDGTLRGVSKWSRFGNLNAPTPELDKKYQRQQDIYRLMFAPYAKCDSVTLRKMVELLNSDEASA